MYVYVCMCIYTRYWSDVCICVYVYAIYSIPYSLFHINNITVRCLFIFTSFYVITFFLLKYVALIIFWFCETTKKAWYWLSRGFFFLKVINFTNFTPIRSPNVHMSHAFSVTWFFYHVAFLIEVTCFDIW